MKGSFVSMHPKELRANHRIIQKFVVLCNQNKQADLFIMAPIELSKYHATIVERFCLLNNIDGSKKKINVVMSACSIGDYFFVQR